jgi:hypothetical protein
VSAWWSRQKKKQAQAGEKAPPPPRKRSVPSGLVQKCDTCGETLESEKV